MNDVSLKAKIRNIAKEKGIPAQLVLQNYLFERLLLRLSRTEYSDKFVIKGGILISSIVGLSSRATMDLDTTLKDLPLTPEQIEKAIRIICAENTSDGIAFELIGLEPIRDDDVYGGYRVSIKAKYGKICAPMTIDVSTGDVITPGATQHEFKMMFEDSSIRLWSYNIETILGEKIETILSRTVYNTRPRDFYDVYALINTTCYDKRLFCEALTATAEHRGTLNSIKDIHGLLQVISESGELKRLWENYRKQFQYAAEIEYSMTVSAMKELLSGITL